jgi:hypothetical protein
LARSCAIGHALAHQLQALDPARIGIEHVELEAGHRLDDLAARGDPPEFGKDETADRVDVFRLLRNVEIAADNGCDVDELCLGIDDEGIVGKPRDLLLGGVVLVLDVADDDLDDVFERDQPVGARRIRR